MALSYTYIINPQAGGRRAARRRQQLLSELQDSPAEVLLTRHSGQAHAWAQARRDQAQRVVVAVGGDGTAHEVGTALIDAAATLAVLPLGSGNDFAHALGQTWPPRGALCPAQAEVLRVDAAQIALQMEDGRWHQRAFINSAGIGIEGAIAQLAPRLRPLGGYSRYLAAALVEAWRFPAPWMRWSLDGERGEGHSLLLAVGNGPRAGGGFVLHPQAQLADGHLDLCQVGEQSRWRRAQLLPSLILGRHSHQPEVQVRRIQRLEMECPEGVAVHADGELLATAARALRIELRPAALKLLVL